MTKRHRPSKPVRPFRLTSHGSRRHVVEEWRRGAFETVYVATQLSMAQQHLNAKELELYRELLA